MLQPVAEHVVVYATPSRGRPVLSFVDKPEAASDGHAFINA